MDRHEAAALVRAVEADLVLPVHYDTFEAIETDAEAFKRDLEADGIAVELF
jgi:L-ascorbate metabolism protein UlaG (beta-lactamase superfamily)